VSGDWSIEVNLTAKSRYALKIMIDLAVHRDLASRQRMAISSEHGVPADFMDHILARLREAGLVESIRGRLGGYRLAKAPHDINAFDIFSAVEGGLEPVQCLSNPESCSVCQVCNSKFAWEQVFSSIQDVLKRQTLAEFVTFGASRDKGQPIPQNQQVIECRSPRRAIGVELK